MKNSESKTGLARRLGVFDASSIVIGSMIGSGIFIAPSLMAGFIQTPGLLILLWLTGGVLTVFAALSLGELAAAFPRAGGQYVFLKEAYSPLWGFLFGWTFFLVVQSGFIAAVAIAFAKYLGVFFPFLGEANKLFSLGILGKTVSLSTAQVASIVCIVLLTAVNIRGVRAGAALQNTVYRRQGRGHAAPGRGGIHFFPGQSEKLHPVAQAGPARRRGAALVRRPGRGHEQGPLRL